MCSDYVLDYFFFYITGFTITIKRTIPLKKSKEKENIYIFFIKCIKHYITPVFPKLDVANNVPMCCYITEI